MCKIEHRILATADNRALNTSKCFTYDLTIHFRKKVNLVKCKKQNFCKTFVNVLALDVTTTLVRSCVLK